MEQWKDVPNYNGKYEASTLGRIRIKETGYIVRESHNGRGYLKTHLNRKTFKVHRIIAETFLPRIVGKDQVNHMNSIRTDNRVENLEWVTERENKCHKAINNPRKNKYIGVTKYGRKYRATISINSKKVYLGVFVNEEDAYEARVEYEREHNIDNKYL